MGSRPKKGRWAPHLHSCCGIWPIYLTSQLWVAWMYRLMKVTDVCARRTRVMRHSAGCWNWSLSALMPTPTPSIWSILFRISGTCCAPSFCKRISARRWRNLRKRYITMYQLVSFLLLVDFCTQSLYFFCCPFHLFMCQLKFVFNVC